MPKKLLDWINGALVLVLLAMPVGLLASEEIFEILKTIALDCAAEHGYEDWNPGAFEEYELRPGEKDWRHCVYAGMREELMPNSAYPDEWEEMIEQDMEYTAKIEKGEMTRFERWVMNRKARELTLVNESLTSEQEGLSRQQETLDEFSRRQIELLLRLPPTVPILR